jgi:hypothetical protein
MTAQVESAAAHGNESVYVASRTNGLMPPWNKSRCPFCTYLKKSGAFQRFGWSRHRKHVAASLVVRVVLFFRRRSRLAGQGILGANHAVFAC